MAEHAVANIAEIFKTSKGYNMAKEKTATKPQEKTATKPQAKKTQVKKQVQKKTQAKKRTGGLRASSVNKSIK